MFAFLAKINDGGVNKTIRGRIDTDDAAQAVTQGIAKLPGTLKEQGLEAATIGAITVKRIAGSSGFVVSAPKGKGKSDSAPAAKTARKRGGR